jgi:hypothetical protein
MSAATVTAGNLRDITGIERIDGPPPSSMNPWLWWLLGIAACVVVIAAWKWRRRARPHVPPLPPDAQSLAELDQLESAAGELDTAQFHTRLDEIVRTYIGQCWQVPTFHRTSAELLETVEPTFRISAARQKTLATMLERCDLAKFARTSYSAVECLESANLARQFIELSDGSPRK